MIAGSGADDARGLSRDDVNDPGGLGDDGGLRCGVLGVGCRGLGCGQAAGEEPAGDHGGVADAAALGLVGLGLADLGKDQAAEADRGDRHIGMALGKNAEGYEQPLGGGVVVDERSTF